MKEEEQRLAAEIESLLFRAEQTDQREDDQYGRGERPDDLPPELQRREARLQRIREAKAALEQEAAQARAAQLREAAGELRAQAEVALDPTVAQAGRHPCCQYEHRPMSFPDGPKTTTIRRR